MLGQALHFFPSLSQIPCLRLPTLHVPLDLRCKLYFSPSPTRSRSSPLRGHELITAGSAPRRSPFLLDPLRFFRAAQHSKRVGPRQTLVLYFKLVFSYFFFFDPPPRPPWVSVDRSSFTTSVPGTATLAGELLRVHPSQLSLPGLQPAVFDVTRY